MEECVVIKAAETLQQHELVEFLISRFGAHTKLLTKEPHTVETCVPAHSPEFNEIRNFIMTKRKLGQDGFARTMIGHYFRKYNKTELEDAEILRLTIVARFETSGEESGTIYETLCPHCNLGRQLSHLILDVRKGPHTKDLSRTSAWVEWLASRKVIDVVRKSNLTGVEFQPVFEFDSPSKQSKDWHQLCITGRAGSPSSPTRIGQDPFSSPGLIWSCPLGHAVSTQLLSELYFERGEWDGSDMATTNTLFGLFGQARHVIRPIPLIIISQRTYRALRDARVTGVACEVAHLL